MKNYETHEIETSNDLYGYTIKLMDKKAPTHEDYVPLLQKLNSRIEVLSNVFEDKNKHGLPATLHVHGVFKCNKNPYLKKVLGNGVHVKLEKIYNLAGWRKYMFKNSEKRDIPYPDPLF